MPVFGELPTGVAPDMNMAKIRPTRAVLQMDFKGAFSKRDS
jgi:hypothetical protein